MGRHQELLFKCAVELAKGQPFLHPQFIADNSIDFHEHVDLHAAAARIIAGHLQLTVLERVEIESKGALALPNL